MLDALLSVWEVYWVLAGRQPDASDHQILDGVLEDWQPHFDFDWEQEKWEDENEDVVEAARLADWAVKRIAWSPWERVSELPAGLQPRLIAEIDSPDLGIRWRARLILEALSLSDEPVDGEIRAALQRDKDRVAEAFREARNNREAAKPTEPSPKPDPREEWEELARIPPAERTQDWLERARGVAEPLALAIRKADAERPAALSDSE